MYLFAVSAALFFSVAAIHVAEDVSPPTGDYLQVIGLIHLDSSVSGGENTPEMIAAVARNAGTEVGILTDHDTQRVTYGILPLRNILKNLPFPVFHPHVRYFTVPPRDRRGVQIPAPFHRYTGARL